MTFRTARRLLAGGLMAGALIVSVPAVVSGHSGPAPAVHQLPPPLPPDPSGSSSPGPSSPAPSPSPPPPSGYRAPGSR